MYAPLSSTGVEIKSSITKGERTVREEWTMGAGSASSVSDESRGKRGKIGMLLINLTLRNIGTT